ncbi:MAG: glycosyltransferase family 39 protein [Bacteroidales bacterium]|nr:glycosyltransferase family 39 protein [Bacteroidales bacterium]
MLNSLRSYITSNKLSITAFVIIAFFFIRTRFVYSEMHYGWPLKVTTYDALGYYMYLPAVFIYHDVKELKWFAGIDEKYTVSGGWVYQANRYKNGNYVFKYLGGVAILQLPFFFAGHIAALAGGYEADGFSMPYQYAIGFGAVFWCLLSIVLLINILRRWFSDHVTAITLILLTIASNLIQYIAVDGGQSHAWIFPLYVFVLYTTLQWHIRPSMAWAAATGLIIGLATISRPTEAIMLFIPLFWNTHTKEAAKLKWALLKENKSHILVAALAGLAGVLPQLIYWKIATGSFVYDVGSKWDFLTPHLRVLTGWEKGWFVYTPVTLFFVAGFFVIKKFPFGKSVLVFCLLNIYIIISWHDWRYGGSYSARALTQSYPVFALPLAAFIDRISRMKWRYLFYPAAVYLLVVNLFQIRQCNNTVLHFSDMNRKYYSRIYLNPDPDPLDMSLLDTDEWIGNESRYKTVMLMESSRELQVELPADGEQLIESLTVCPGFTSGNVQNDRWLKIEVNALIHRGFYESWLKARIIEGDSAREVRIRLFSPISHANEWNDYAFYMKIPGGFRDCRLDLSIATKDNFTGTVGKRRITGLYRKE